MCGIIITDTLDKIISRFKVQKERGLDSIGIFDCGTGNAYWYIDDGKEVDKKSGQSYLVKGQTLSDTKLKNYIKHLKSLKNLKGPFVFHHRLSSAGEIDIKNCHPLCMNSFALMQNGTTPMMKDYLKVAVREHPELTGRSDTYATAFLIDKMPEHKEEIISMCVGVMVYIDYKKKCIEVYSDGARSFYVDTDETIFASLDGDGDEYTFKGKIVFNFDLSISEKEYTQVVKTAYQRTAKTITPYQESLDYYSGSNYYNSNYNKSKALPRLNTTEPFVVKNATLEPFNDDQFDFGIKNIMGFNCTTFDGDEYGDPLRDSSDFISINQFKKTQKKIPWSNTMERLVNYMYPFVAEYLDDIKAIIKEQDSKALWKAYGDFLTNYTLDFRDL